MQPQQKHQAWLHFQQQKWQIEQSKQQLPAALRRSEDINYTSGYFFVTLNVREKYPVLGTIQGHYHKDSHKVENVRVECTDVGKTVEHCWSQIPHYHPGVQVIANVVMPEHFHGLLYIDPNHPVSLGKIIRGFMTGCTHGYWDALGISWHDMKQNTKEGQWDPQWVDRDHRTSKRGPSLFVRGYNDTIPLDQSEVEIKKEYIRTNPERRLIKGNLQNQFAIIRNQHSANWTEDAIHRGLCRDDGWRTHPNALAEALAALRPRLLCREIDISSTLAIDYLGHRPLLMESRKLPLICHRADAGRFQEQADAVLREARNGAVIVSAFISKKERDILHLLLEEQLPVIEICDNGFGQRYKPFGKSFYACAEDRLLQITCWQYEYREKHICTRAECMVMNELARVICKTEDDWWKT